MISIIIPVYNQGGKINKCLKSILAQSIKDFEVIIVNDGSTDSSQKVAEKARVGFEKQGLNYKVLRQENQGAPTARNAGFQEAKGKYLLFCDSDIVLKPDCLKMMLENLEAHPEASYVYSSFYWGRKIFRLNPFSRRKLKEMPFIHTTSLIRANHFPETGWDQSIKRFQDWDLWLTMLEEGHIGYWIDRPLFKVASTKGTISDWLPSFAYKLFPFLPGVKKYYKAMAIIKEKHFSK